MLGSHTVDGTPGCLCDTLRIPPVFVAIVWIVVQMRINHMIVLGFVD